MICSAPAIASSLRLWMVLMPPAADVSRLAVPAAASAGEAAVQFQMQQAGLLFWRGLLRRLPVQILEHGNPSFQLVYSN